MGRHRISRRAHACCSRRATKCVKCCRVPPVTRVPGAATVGARARERAADSCCRSRDLRAWLRGRDGAGTAQRRGCSPSTTAAVPAGLIVDEVYGFRRFREGEQKAPSATPFAGIEELVTGSFTRDGETWPVLSLKRLVESQRFLNAASRADLGSCSATARFDGEVNGEHEFRRTHCCPGWARF